MVEPVAQSLKEEGRGTFCRTVNVVALSAPVACHRRNNRDGTAALPFEEVGDRCEEGYDTQEVGAEFLFRGGGLVYVPVDWVRSAHMGIDELTSIYVSMGLTPPSASKTRRGPGLDPDHGKGL